MSKNYREYFRNLFVTKLLRKLTNGQRARCKMFRQSILIKWNNIENLFIILFCRLKINGIKLWIWKCITLHFSFYEIVLTRSFHGLRLFARFLPQLRLVREQKERPGYRDAGASPTEVAGCVKRNVAGSACVCVRACERKEGKRKGRSLGSHPRSLRRLSSSSPTIPFSCPIPFGFYVLSSRCLRLFHQRRW